MKRILKHTYIVFIIFSVLFIISGCKEKEAEIIVSFEQPETGQPFQIVNVYKLFTDVFEKASQENQQEDIKELYQTMIIDRIYNQCFSDGEYIHLVDNLLYNAPTDGAALNKLIEKIDSDKINEEIKEALIKSSNLLPTESETTICVFPTIDEYIPADMVTVGAGKILAFYHKDYTEERIKSVIAHEYHHSVWTEKYLDTEGFDTVLDNLIFEGKAVAFQYLVYPDISNIPVYPYYSWTDWEKIEPDLSTQNLYRTLEILRGGGDLPDLYGYSIGYKLVKSYLDKNPSLAPAEWIGISADEIYEEWEEIISF